MSGDIIAQAQSGAVAIQALKLQVLLAIECEQFPLRLAAMQFGT